MKVDRKIFSVSSGFKDTTSKEEYWLSQSPQDRIRHIETLRRINYGSRATERLQRFFELVHTFFPNKRIKFLFLAYGSITHMTGVNLYIIPQYEKFVLYIRF